MLAGNLLRRIFLGPLAAEVGSPKLRRGTRRWTTTTSLTQAARSIVIVRICGWVVDGIDRDGDNDYSGEDGETLTATLAAQARNGIAVLQSDGSFTYTPNPHFSGDDSFSYLANDGQLTGNLASRTVHVTPSEDVAINSFTTDGAQLSIAFTVTGGSSAPFYIGLYASPDGTLLGQRLETLTASGTPGSHSVTLAPYFTDPTGNYYLRAKVDANDDINESNENNNEAAFAGGNYLLNDSASGESVLQVQQLTTSQAVMLSADSKSLTLGSRSLAGVSHTLSDDDGVGNFDVTGDTAYNADGSIDLHGVIDLLDARVIAYDLVHAERLWQNADNRWDVNGDGFVSSADALEIINAVNGFGPTLLDQPRGTSGFLAGSDGYLDVTGDNVVSWEDAQCVIDKINGGSGTVAEPHQNPDNPLDVNSDGTVDQTDEQVILDYLTSIAPNGPSQNYDVSPSTSAPPAAITVRTHDIQSPVTDDNLTAELVTAYVGDSTDDTVGDAPDDPSPPDWETQLISDLGTFGIAPDPTSAPFSDAYNDLLAQASAAGLTPDSSNPDWVTFYTNWLLAAIQAGGFNPGNNAASDGTVTVTVPTSGYEGEMDLSAHVSAQRSGHLINSITLDWIDGNEDITNEDYGGAGISISFYDDSIGRPNGKYPVTATVWWDDGKTSVGSAEIAISNIGPAAIDDTAKTSKTSDVTFNVLENDTDPGTFDQERLRLVSIDTTGTLGYVSFDPSGNGDVFYNPNGAFDGLGLGEYADDTFRYTVADPNGATSVGTVTVTIMGEYDVYEVSLTVVQGVASEDIQQDGSSSAKLAITINPPALTTVNVPWSLFEQKDFSVEVPPSDHQNDAVGSPNDWDQWSGTVTFSPGQSYATINLTALDDTTVELNEYDLVGFVHPDGTPATNGFYTTTDYRLDFPDTTLQSVKILDNEWRWDKKNSIRIADNKSAAVDDHVLGWPYLPSNLYGNYDVKVKRIDPSIPYPVEGGNTIHVGVAGLWEDGGVFGYTTTEGELSQDLTFDYDSQTGVIYPRNNGLHVSSTGGGAPLGLLVFSQKPNDFAYQDISPTVHIVTVAVRGDVSVEGKWSYGQTTTFGGSFGGGVDGGTEFNWSADVSWGAHLGATWQNFIQLRLIRGANN